MNYYNEIDAFAAEWLRELIKQNLIAPGVVDERSIEDITPNEIKEFTQCHFFAGIGVWSYALRSAGWSDDRPVWTGSCPCQPFSAAGKGGGFDDERHLWPAWFHLIRECKPNVVFGEQVASKPGLSWFDLVQTDMEDAGYAVGTADLCAAGVGAPHIRQRLWFVAEGVADSYGGNPGAEREQPCGEYGLQPENGSALRTGHKRSRVESSGVADSNYKRLEGRERMPECVDQFTTRESGLANPVNGFWRDADWLGCRDGKFRPVEPGSQPLVDGTTNRVGRLRGYGNAINAEVAKAFIQAYMSKPVDLLKGDLR